jgi:predicted DNA-binding transcriptional regulator YafY
VKYNTRDEPEAPEGYVIERRDFYLPYLRLVQQAGTEPAFTGRSRVANVEIDESDAPVALAALRRVAEVPGFPLAKEARSAFRKLAFDLDPHAFEQRSEVLFMEPPGSADLAARLRTLSDALLARKTVTFRYHGIYRGEETSRTVAAYGMLFQRGHWYLIGHDEMRDGIRVFRVARMDGVSMNTRSPNTADYTIPDDFRLGEYAGREAWELGEEDEAVTARIRFVFPLSLWAERNGHGELESRDTEGSVVRVFTVHQINPFLRWLLTLEGEVEVLEPESLKSELRALARSIALAHGPAASGA